MSNPRWVAQGGSLIEHVAGRWIERDPYELRRWAESWSRDALAFEHTDLPRARLYARNADEALWALSVWALQRKAATGRDPFEERAA